MFEIPRSMINGSLEDFAKDVEAHIAELRAHTKTRRGEPRPSAHPLIEASVKRVQAKGQPDSYSPDYTVVEEEKPQLAAEAAPTLESKKQALYEALHVAEHKAQEEILPMHKHRLLTLSVQAAYAKLEKERSVTDNQIIATYNKRSARLQAIALLSAKAEADICDLTETNVDQYKLPSF